MRTLEGGEKTTSERAPLVFVLDDDTSVRTALESLPESFTTVWIYLDWFLMPNAVTCSHLSTCLIRDHLSR